MKKIYFLIFILCSIELHIVAAEKPPVWIRPRRKTKKGPAKRPEKKQLGTADKKSSMHRLYCTKLPCPAAPCNDDEQKMLAQSHYEKTCALRCAIELHSGKYRLENKPITQREQQDYRTKAIDLLCAGADPNSLPTRLRFYGVGQDDYEYTQVELNHDADPNIVYDETAAYYDEPITYNKYYGYQNREKVGTTPLYHARTEKMARLLRRHGALLQSPGTTATPLHTACSSDAIEPAVVKFYLDQGIDPNCKDSSRSNTTPLLCLAYHFNRIDARGDYMKEKKRYLLEAGADASITDAEGKTADEMIDKAQEKKMI